MKNDPPPLYPTLDDFDSTYIRLAIKQAQKSEYPQKHGAVLTRGGSVISTGYNKPYFNKFSHKFKRGSRSYKNPIGTQHAEIRAILGIDKKKTQGATVYVIRIGNGEYKERLRNSKPCLMCQEAMKFVGIKKVVYSINDGIKAMCL